MTFTAGSFAGSPVRRVEDPSLLRGAGTYVDNLDVDGMLIAQFVRSPIAHALIRSDRHRAQRARCPAWSPSTPPTISSFPSAPAFMLLHPDSGPTALAQGQRELRRRSGRGGRRRDARASRRRRGGSSMSTTTRSPPPSTWKRRSRPTRRCSSRRSARTSSIGRRDGDGADVLDDADVRRARPHREPARRGGADGGRRGRGRARTTATPYLDDRVPRVPDAAPILERDRGRAGHRAPSDARDRAQRRWRVRGEGVGVGARRRRRSRCELGRPVKWVETRSENLVAMGHGRGPGPVRRDGLQTRRHDHRAAVPDRRRRRRVRRLRRHPRGRADHGPWRRACTASRSIAYDVAVAVTQHHADGRVPRCGAAGGGRVPRADHGHRAPTSSGIDPVELRRRNFIRPDEFPLHHAHGRQLRQRRLRARARRSAAHRRLRRRCAPSRSSAARAATACSSASACRVYVEVTGGGRQRVRRGRGARRRPRDDAGRARRRTGRVTPRRSR